MCLRAFDCAPLHPTAITTRSKQRNRHTDDIIATVQRGRETPPPDQIADEPLADY